jgi:hypothetical protein
MVLVLEVAIFMTLANKMELGLPLKGLKILLFLILSGITLIDLQRNDQT